MDLERPSFHRQNDVPGRERVKAVVALVLAVLVIALIGAGTATGYLLAAAAVPLALTLPSALRGTWRAGVRRDAGGLRECGPLGFGRRVSFEQMRAVEIEADHAIVHTTEGPLKLAPPLCDWLALALVCREAVEGQRAEAAEPWPDISAAQVATWLGLPPEGELECVSGYHAICSLVRPPLLALTLALLIIPPIGLALWLGTSASGWFGPAGRRRDQRVLEVRAGGDAIAVRTPLGWRRFGWGSLVEVARRGAFTVVTTTQGDVWLPPGLSDGDLLIRAIEQAVEARREGLTLPRLPAEVSAAAISRAGGEASARRGLTVVP